MDGCGDMGENSQSSRPRRSTRQPTKIPVELAAPPSSNSAARNDKGKRKAEVDEEDVAAEPKTTTGKKRTSTKEKKNNLEYILTNPKSPLVNLDIFVSNIKKIEVNSAICTILILDHPGLSLC